MNKRLFLTIAILAIIFAFVYFTTPITLPNTLQRESASMLIVKYTVEDVWNTSSPIEAFSEYYNHYSIFTGFTEWPPLQIILLAGLYLIFGFGKFVPFLFSIVSIMLFVYAFSRLFSLFTKDKKIIISGILLTLLNIFVLFSTLSTNIDFGTLIFILLTYYEFIQYNRTFKTKYLYRLSLFFGLGAIYKFEFIITGIILAIAFFVLNKNNLKKYFTKEMIKPWLLSMLIVLGILLVFFIPQAFLAQYGLSPLKKRTIDHFITNDESKEQVDIAWPIITGEQYHFIGEQSSELKIAIAHRRDIPIQNRFITTLTSLFHQWFIIPLFILYLFIRTKMKKMKDLLLLCDITLIVWIILFSLLHVLPRYTIILLPFMIMPALLATKKKFPKYVHIIGIILICLSLFQCVSYIYKTEQGRNSTAHQHDFSSTIEYILTTQSGEAEIGIVVPWIKHFARESIIQDTHEQIYLQSLPSSKEEFDLLLMGEKSNEFLEEHNENLLSKIYVPQINFIVIMEGYEIDQNPELTNKFNRKAYVESREDFSLISTIPSTNEEDNSKIWIYKRT